MQYLGLKWRDCRNELREAFPRIERIAFIGLYAEKNGAHPSSDQSIELNFRCFDGHAEAIHYLLRD